MATYGVALAKARAALAKAGIENAALDARLLLSAATGLDTASLISRSEETLPELENTKFQNHMARRLAGEPVARIVGETEFWGLPISLNAATLVPRPETETLVEVVVREARSRLPEAISICDLGTGSGAIALALLSELPKARALATDISQEALAMARLNAERLGLSSRIAFQRMDFAEGPHGPFDVVVTNPPYVASDAIDRLQIEVREHDPRVALDGGADGLAAYRTILARIASLLAHGGMLALEIGCDQAESVAALCSDAGLSEPRIVKDLGARPRVILAAAGVPGGAVEAPKKALGKVG